MTTSLKGTSLLELSDLTPQEIRGLLDLAATLKREKKAGMRHPRLAGKNIVLIFEKTSTRTRCAFEVAAYDLGMGVTYLDPTGSQIGHKESIKDTARVLGRMYDAIEYRGFAQKVVEDLAAYSGVPVYNGLTDAAHPTQILADFMTMEEHGGGKPLGKMAYAYLGDSRNNMGNSLMLGGTRLGMDVRIAGPKALWPDAEVVDKAKRFAAESGAKIMVTDDPKAAVAGVDFVYTDVWVSLGEPPQKWAERIEMVKPYQVNAALMKAAGPSARFMHCLPAFHNRETTKGEELFTTYGMDGLEVTEDVFESKASIVWDQAENRMHTIKALLVATLG